MGNLLTATVKLKPVAGVARVAGLVLARSARAFGHMPRRSGKSARDRAVETSATPASPGERKCQRLMALVDHSPSIVSMSPVGVPGAAPIPMRSR